MSCKKKFQKESVIMNTIQIHPCSSVVIFNRILKNIHNVTEGYMP